MAFGPAVARFEPAPVATAVASTVAQAQPVAAQVHAPLPAIVAPPQAAPTGFEAYKNWLSSRARREGVREATIRSVVPFLPLNSRVMQLDRAQRPSPSSVNSTPPLAPYLRNHVTPSLISRGQARYSEHWPNLAHINASYGVDPAVVMAIYGKETSYGTVTGSFDLLEALATLAYEGRRREMFETEFLAALKLLDQGVPRHWLKGSYAGATGFPQFMPSVVLRLRADGDRDGYADIWRNEADAFASIANYLRDAGWKRDIPWGVSAAVPATLNRAAIRPTINPPRCPRVFQRHSRWLTIREWRALGVVPTGAGIPETEMATLMEPDGPGQGGYLLTHNYRVILDYNCSNFYAMSVGLLSDRIARR
jgi:lytic murein transglycosylase